MESSYLDRLLEIWDLDIESCSHLLQDPELSQAKESKPPGTSLCTSSQTLDTSHSNGDSVDTQKLNCITDCRLNKSLHAFSRLDLVDDVESSRIRSNCPSCCNDNDKDANWCIHCGTALVSKRFDMNTPQNLHQTSIDIDIPRLLLDATSCDISASPDELECTTLSSTSGSLKPNDKSRQTTIQESNHIFKLQPSPQQTHTRHWNTSSTYTWRKPSSLDTRKSHFKHQSDIPTCSKEPIQDQLEHTVASSIPRLNLSSITQINADGCLSTRRKLSANIKKSQSHDSLSPLESLPNEILLFIASLLNEKDLVSCMYVCSRLYLIATESCLWKRVTMTKKQLEQNHLMSLAQQCTCLEILVIEKCSLKAEPNLDLNTFFQRLPLLKHLQCVLTDFGCRTGDILLLSAALNCPLLNSIEFDWITLSEEAIQRSIQLIPRLESVSIRQPGTISHKTLNLLFAHHNKWLKYLNMRVNDHLTVEKILIATEYFPVPNLQTLAMITVNQAHFVDNLQQVFPSLECLKIIQDTLSTEITARLSSVPLRSLHLQVYTFSDLVTCCKDLSRMSSLRELCLNCVDDDGVAILCNGQLSLETLDLSNSYITLLSLSRISESSFSQVLRSLKLNHCQRMRRPGTTAMADIESSILSLIRNCPELRFIEMMELLSIQVHVTDFLKRMNNHTCKLIF